MQMLAVSTRILLASLLCVLVWRYCNEHRLTPYSQCHNDAPVLVGTHHKTGTVLLQHILKDACRQLRWRCTFNHHPHYCASPEDAIAANLQLCFLQHGIRFRLQSGASYRFIHGIRDPFEVVLSGYQDHLKTTESWAHRPDPRWNGTSYLKHLNAIPLREGLLTELQHSMRDSLKTMPRLFNRTHDNPCTLEVRLGDFARDWSGTIGRIWDLMGVKNSVMLRQLNTRVERHNVYGVARRGAFNKHVEKNSSSRDTMRTTMRSAGNAYHKIQRVRRSIGFPAVGREGVA